MAKVLVTDTNLTNIANAIRGKNGTQTTYTPAEMAAAITAIPSGGGSSKFTYEEGSFTYEGNDRTPDKVYFAKTHTKTPMLVIFYDNGEVLPETSGSTLHFTFLDYTKLGMINHTLKGHMRALYYGTNAKNKDIVYDTSYEAPSGGNTYARYFVNESWFYPYSTSTTERWRNGRTYKWIAIWADE